MTGRRDDLTPSLIAQLRTGHSTAGRLLMELYREPLVRFAWGYLGHRADAEDAVQEIFCKVLAAREVPESFRAWIYRIARNHCLNARRGRARRRDGAPLPSELRLADSLPGAATRLGAEEERARLVRAVRGLAEEAQEVLRLRYAEGLAREEIAAVLEVPVSTVKSRLYDATRKLRAALE